MCESKGMEKIDEKEKAERPLFFHAKNKGLEDNH